MSELVALQRAFAAALSQTQGVSGPTDWLVGEATSIERRIAIYRENVAVSALKALASTYPVIERIVGTNFFEGLSRAYSRCTPSTSGDLHEYGDAFASFLGAFEHVQSMPYLADVARLEWCVQRAYGADDGSRLDLAKLAEVPPDRHAEVVFKWAPGTDVVDSDKPIARIWTIHQQGFDGEFSVDWAVAETALVCREDYRVSVSALSTGEAAFVHEALRGGSLGVATHRALQADPSFDAGPFLARAVASHLICDFSLET